MYNVTLNLVDVYNSESKSRCNIALRCILRIFILKGYYNPARGDGLKGQSPGKKNNQRSAP